MARDIEYSIFMRLRQNRRAFKQHDFHTQIARDVRQFSQGFALQRCAQRVGKRDFVHLVYEKLRRPTRKRGRFPSSVKRARDAALRQMPNLRVPVEIGATQNTFRFFVPRGFAHALRMRDGAQKKPRRAAAVDVIARQFAFATARGFHHALRGNALGDQTRLR